MSQNHTAEHVDFEGSALKNVAPIGAHIEGGFATNIELLIIIIAHYHDVIMTSPLRHWRSGDSRWVPSVRVANALSSSTTDQF